MKSRSPAGRVVAACAGVLFLALGIYHLLALRAGYSELCRDMGFACPLAIGVDFSSVGQYSVLFSRGPVHYVKGSFLGLDVPETTLSGTSPDRLLAGLDAVYTVLDSEGRKVYSGSLTGRPAGISPPGFPNVLCLSDDLGWFPEGRHRIDISVARGAPALQRVPQRFVLTIDDGSINMRRAALRGRARIGGGTLAIAAGILVFAAGLPTRISRWANPHDSACRGTMISP